MNLCVCVGEKGSTLLTKPNNVDIFENRNRFWYFIIIYNEIS